MRSLTPILLLTLFSAALFTRPAIAQDSTRGAEKLLLHVDTLKNIITPAVLTPLDAPSMAERSGKAIFLPIILGYAVNKGVQEVQQLITDHKNKFITQYNFAERDHYFYDQVSAAGSFDPTGMEFRGFTILRLVRKAGAHDRLEDATGRNKDAGPFLGRGAHGGGHDHAAEDMDTVFMAKFIVDTTEGKCNEMINNGIFRLRLDSIRISEGRVKAPRHYKRLNLDFEIDFTATYRGDNGQLYSDAAVGKFVYPLRDAPLYGKDTAAPRYYDSLDMHKPPLTGECFMIPRSTGFHKNNNGVIEGCWGQGLYAINVTVKETTKMKYIDKIIVFSSDPALNIGSSLIQKKISGGK